MRIWVLGFGRNRTDDLWINGSSLWPTEGISSNLFLWKRSKSSVVIQRSSMSAGSKRRALAFYFCVRIYHTFLKPNRRGESDIGLCTTSQLANRMQAHLGKFWRICGQTHFHNWKSPPGSGICFASTEIMHGPTSNSTLRFVVRNIMIKQIRMEK